MTDNTTKLSSVFDTSDSIEVKIKDSRRNLTKYYISVSRKYKLKNQVAKK